METERSETNKDIVTLIDRLSHKSNQESVTDDGNGNDEGSNIQFE